ncbi:MAG: hypothetical protein WC551_14275 [Patescibacteria group bacterium]
METEILDKLFLELSQFTKARTAREIRLAEQELFLRGELRRRENKIKELEKITANNSITGG